jgi:hypothetical protein
MPSGSKKKSGKRKRNADSSSSEEERVAVKKTNNGGSRAGTHWSDEENQLLKALRGKGHRWEKIGESFPTRTAEVCGTRYNKHVKEGEKKAAGVAWSTAEHELLKSLKEEEGLTW